MAEVPEVETLVRDMRASLVGRTLMSTEVCHLPVVRFPDADEFANILTNRVVLNAQRRAKYMLVSVSDNLLLGIHLALWGTVALVERSLPRLPETLVVWHFDREQDLRLVDKLGYARVAVGTPDVLSEKLDLGSLGPEALDPEFSVEVLTRQIGSRRGVLKSVLLNQRILAGLGNRDTDESLWMAGIDPRRAAASLTMDEVTRLHAAIVTVLSEGIALRGTQRDLFGRKGQAVHRRNIFERTREPCPRCGTPIAFLRIGGRNTYYCPTCQH